MNWNSHTDDLDGAARGGRGDRAVRGQACARAWPMTLPRWPAHGVDAAGRGRGLPANGDDRSWLSERAWAPRLGIEYHLGVDGLGALMLVLSAIVTLMSIDAAHRVETAAGALLCAGAAARGGPVRDLHCAEFLPLVLVLGAEPDPGVLPHQAVGRGAKRGPAATQFFVYTMAGLGGAAAGVSWRSSWPPTAWTSTDPHAAGVDRRAGADGARRIWALSHDVACAVGVLAGLRRESPAHAVPHWLPAAYSEAPSPVTMLLTGTMSKMGVYGLLRHRAADVRARDRPDAHAAAGAGGR